MRILARGRRRSSADQQPIETGYAEQLVEPVAAFPGSYAAVPASERLGPRFAPGNASAHDYRMGGNGNDFQFPEDTTGIAYKPKSGTKLIRAND